MLYFSIFSIAMVGTSLFAMEKKINNSEKQNFSKSYHMQSMLSSIRGCKGDQGVDLTYTYSDGSKSTYTYYSNPSDQRK